MIEKPLDSEKAIPVKVINWDGLKFPGSSLGVMREIYREALDDLKSKEMDDAD